MSIKKSDDTRTTYQKQNKSAPLFSYGNWKLNDEKQQIELSVLIRIFSLWMHFKIVKNCGMGEL